jgi:tRNA(Ile)-lysidine synthase
MQKQFDRIMAELLSSSAETATLPFLLAVSGGVDSMVMANLFLKSSHDLNFALAHCNFSLRGEESDGDEALVREWCANNGVRLHSIRFDTKEYAKNKALSIEMAARELRYQWFAEFAKDYSAVVVAHNANDNAETLFLNLVRGTGVDGIAGMSLSDVLPVEGGENVLLLRPLLNFTRNQIEGFAFAEKIQYRTDSTNLDVEYKRNRLRNQVFPIFEQMNPSFVKTISREMGYFSQIRNIADEWIESQTADIDPRSIDIHKLLSKSNWEYILYRLLSKFDFNSSVIASVQKLIQSEGVTLSGKTYYSGSHILYTTSSTLLVKEKHDLLTNSDLSEDEPVMVVRGCGLYNFNGNRIEVEQFEYKEGMNLKCLDGTLVFDSSKMPFPFILRRWEAGDYFFPLGLRGKKKVSDLFTDLKYSIPQKHTSVMVVKPMDEEGRIRAVLGKRIDDSLKVDCHTKTIVKITVL